jgi:hypothetical protein
VKGINQELIEKVINSEPITAELAYIPERAFDADEIRAKEFLIGKNFSKKIG